MTFGSSPYPGPRPYARGEHDVFFARARETAEMCDLAVSFDVVVIYARSGAGKTSLLQAGLGPRLDAQGTKVLFARVGSDGGNDDRIPNVFVHNALCTLRQTEDTLATPEILESLREASLEIGLQRLVPGLQGKGLPTGKPQETLVIFDQCEELFTTNQSRWRHREAFVKQTVDALRSIDHLHVVISIRADFLAELDPYARLLSRIDQTRYRLERLREASAVEAVVKPLETRKIRLDEANALEFVRGLMKGRDGDVGEFVETVHLQLACENLWKAIGSAPQVAPSVAGAGSAGAGIAFSHENRHFRIDTRTIRSIDETLRAMYDHAIARACKETRVSERTLRTIIDERLITSAHTRGFADVGTFTEHGVPQKALDILDFERVLGRETRAGLPWYELTHDRLVESVRASNDAWKQRQRDRRAVWMTSAAAVLALIVVGIATRITRQAKAEAAEAASNERTASVQVARAEGSVAEADRAVQSADTQLSDTLKALGAVVQDPSSASAISHAREQLGGDAGSESARAADLWRQGYAAYLRGDAVTARSHYLRSLGADPQYAPSLNSLGRLAAEAHDYNGERAYYEKALASQPD
jgi:hypothetical protein